MYSLRSLYLCCLHFKRDINSPEDTFTALRHKHKSLSSSTAMDLQFSMLLQIVQLRNLVCRFPWFSTKWHLSKGLTLASQGLFISESKQESQHVLLYNMSYRMIPLTGMVSMDTFTWTGGNPKPYTLNLLCTGSIAVKMNGKPCINENNYCVGENLDTLLYIPCPPPLPQHKVHSKYMYVTLHQLPPKCSANLQLPLLQLVFWDSTPSEFFSTYFCLLVLLVRICSVHHTAILSCVKTPAICFENLLFWR